MEQLVSRDLLLENQKSKIVVSICLLFKKVQCYFYYKNHMFIMKNLDSMKKNRRKNTPQITSLQIFRYFLFFYGLPMYLQTFSVHNCDHTQRLILILCFLFKKTHISPNYYTFSKWGRVKFASPFPLLGDQHAFKIVSTNCSSSNQSCDIVFKHCQRQKEMADLEHERELAVIEQEMMERLKAEELLFQQVRQDKCGSLGVTGVSGVSLSVVQPKCCKTSHL